MWTETADGPNVAAKDVGSTRGCVVRNYFRHRYFATAIVPVVSVLVAAAQQRGPQVVRVTGLDYALRAPDSVRADQPSHAVLGMFKVIHVK